VRRNKELSSRALAADVEFAAPARQTNNALFLCSCSAPFVAALACVRLQFSPTQ